MKLAVIDSILAEVEKIDLLNVPNIDEKAGDKEREIGVLTDDLKKFYAYLCLLSEKRVSEKERMISQLLYGVADLFVGKGVDNDQEQVIKMQAEKNKAISNEKLFQLSHNLFWGEIREFFKTRHMSIALRADWKLVEISGKCDECLAKDDCLSRSC